MIPGVSSGDVDTVEVLDLVAGIGLAAMVLGGLLVALALLKRGPSEGPGDDPWSGHTLEWATTSPPPIGNFASVPAISSEAPVYDARHAGGRHHGGVRLMATTATDLEIFSEAPPAPPARPRVLLIGSAIGGGGVGPRRPHADRLLRRPAGRGRRRRWRVAARGHQPPADARRHGHGHAGPVAGDGRVGRAGAAQRGPRPRLMAIAITLLLGAAYINVVAYGWQQMGLGIDELAQALLIYTITGLHVAMTGVGMLFLAVMGFKAAGGQLTGRAAEGVSAAALYWFVTVGHLLGGLVHDLDHQVRPTT